MENKKIYNIRLWKKIKLAEMRRKLVTIYMVLSIPFLLSISGPITGTIRNIITKRIQCTWSLVNCTSLTIHNGSWGRAQIKIKFRFEHHKVSSKYIGTYKVYPPECIRLGGKTTTATAGWQFREGSISPSRSCRPNILYIKLRNNDTTFEKSHSNMIGVKTFCKLHWIENESKFMK